MIVRYSPRATKDLQEIHDYLIHRSSQGAVSVLTAIYAAVEFIRRNPSAARWTSVPGGRGMVVHRYRFKFSIGWSKRAARLKLSTFGIHRAVHGRAMQFRL